MSLRAHNGRISVLIADDEAAVRDALIAGLRVNAIFVVVGSVADGDEAVRLAAELRPDVALVDFNMPNGGRHAVSGILAQSPTTRVVALSGAREQTVVLEMLQAGAASYVVKGADPEEISETILRSARGESILSAEVAGGVLEELATHLDHRELTQREVQLIRERIEHVIDGDLIVPAFQPIVDLSTGQRVGLEALSRFPAEPAQSPEVWFNDADRVELRAELELAAARTAIRRFREVSPAGYLALNASPETLDQCGSLLDELASHQVVIEITEHAAIDDYEALAPALDRLRSRGALLAVDDAGAGFASLRHALHLSPDIIKLDVSLTHGVDQDSRRRALATGLIGFAAELGAAIVAEGIETQAELDTLRDLGVTYGQGFFLAEPAPLSP